jgi:hypothetical protein
MILARRRPAVAVPTGVVCGLLALLAAAIALGATLVEHNGNLSVLVHMSPDEPMAEIARADPKFAFVDPAAHYDGVYFFAMAIDPLALGDAHTRIDAPANRYGHPAYAWVSGILTLGQQPLLPVALLLVSLAALFIAAVALSDLASALGLSAWLGLAVPFNPGLIYAVTADTAEAFGAALLAASLLAWLLRRRLLAALLIVPLCFAKEPLLAVPVGLAVWELLRLLPDRLRPRVIGAASVRDAVQALAALAVGPLLYVAWNVYVHTRFGVFPFEQGLDRLSLPFTGWADTLSRASQLSTQGYGEMQVGQAMVPILAVLFVGIGVAAVVALRARTPVDIVYLFSALLMLCLGWLPLLYPKDMIRISSFVLLLAPFVFAAAIQRRTVVAEQAAADPAGPEAPGT